MTGPLWKFERVTLTGVQRPRLDDVSVDIGAGVTAVVGYSGAGKTSLLNLLTQFEAPDSGKISVNLPERDGRMPLYWVPQTNGLWPHLNLREHLQTVLADQSDSDPFVSELLSRFDLVETTDARPDRLSQGECARLAVARAVASRAAVLVLDEPLVHVDPARSGKYWQTLRDHCRETDTTVCIATHSPEIVLREAEHAVCLCDGRVVYSGDVPELYYRPATAQLAEFLGPANWLTADDAAGWLGERQQGDCCYRPEQILISRTEESPLIVQSSRFAGAIAEVELLNEKTNQLRSFFHRPFADELSDGDRVSIRPAASRASDETTRSTGMTNVE